VIAAFADEQQWMALAHLFSIAVSML